MAAIVEFHYAIAFRIVHWVCKYDSSVLHLRCTLQVNRKRLSIKDVVPENQCARIAADEIAAN